MKLSSPDATPSQSRENSETEYEADCDSAGTVY